MSLSYYICIQWNVSSLNFLLILNLYELSNFLSINKYSYVSIDSSNDSGIEKLSINYSLSLKASILLMIPLPNQSNNLNLLFSELVYSWSIYDKENLSSLLPNLNWLTIYLLTPRAFIDYFIFIAFTTFNKFSKLFQMPLHYI